MPQPINDKNGANTNEAAPKIWIKRFAFSNECCFLFSISCTAFVQMRKWRLDVR